MFHEIEQTIKAKPQEAKAVNSIYIFVIKQDGKPVKRWRKFDIYHYYMPCSYLKSSSLVLDLRSTPASMSWGAPSDEVSVSPDCSIICDDKDFFQLVN